MDPEAEAYKLRERASAMAINVVAPFFRLADRAPTLKELVGVCETLRRVTYARTDDDGTARNLLIQYLGELATADPSPERLLALSWAQTTEGALSLLWQCRWADQGFPVVRVGDRLAASFMATGFHRSAASSVLTPWKAFAIIPPPLLQFAGANGEMETVREVRVLTTGAVRFVEYPNNPFAWFVAAMGEKGTMLHMVRAAHALFLPAGSPEPMRHALNQEVTAGDDRVLELAIRLLGGVCLEMSDPNVLEGSKRGKAHSHQARAGHPPEPRVYELTRAVTLDVREAIRAYVAGRRSTSPSVQVLVAGHWKRQRCGPGGVERKIIQIEPYWRGPDLSPVLAKTD